MGGFAWGGLGLICDAGSSRVYTGGFRLIICGLVGFG